ncbi:sigma-70 family RNA polymerase sigma factor [Caulobacter sp. NIBR2454]|uniref:sigma-70 family RNA polymerase sigma factor n=1 Tax=Caulobacter sp. NIBR2454 TaxID=3015996 RepID=UPI0022B5F493|nr:sigma-70 family RNA polymerase sigma factor [Caulobacter sp. NIBR2454]
MSVTHQDEQRAELSRALVRTATGDRRALEEVYNRTSAKLFGVCLRILSDRSEAEDVLQEVYLTVWRKADQFDPDRASPITWLSTLARNRAIDRLRSSGRREARPLDEATEIADEQPSAFDGLSSTQDAQLLNRCMDQLEDKHRAAVRTAFFDGLTYDELARAASVPLGTMKGWIRRSLMKLRVCLES